MTYEETQAAARQEICRKRLMELLERLQTQSGLSQHKIAIRASFPPQYLSDIKHGRRELSELVARRLGEEFKINYEWLLGISDSMEPLVAWKAPGGKATTLSLPVFRDLVRGEPTLVPDWDGTYADICGAAAAKAARARLPYILRFEGQDTLGRLQVGDLILVSQGESAEAKLQVMEYRKKLHLARMQSDGTWERISNGEGLPASATAAGHCLGVVWSAL